MSSTDNSETPGYEIDRKGSGRLYDWDLAERLSRCHPTAPLWLFVPIVTATMTLAFVQTDLSTLTILGLLAGGVFTWTFAEYWLHRTLFHITGESQALQTFHRRMHGIHHEFPNDMSRVVMPPAASILFCIAFWLVCWVSLGTAMALPFFSGLGVGYVWYDMTHWWTHAGRPKSRWGKMLREHHMRHHFQTPDRRFGVSSPLWDWVFRTS